MRTSKSSDLSNVMANIYADYRPYPVWQPSTNYSSTNPTSKIFPRGMNGRFYICKPGSSGTSGLSEPTQWSDSGDTPDNQVTWNAGVWQPSTPYNVCDIVIPRTPNGHFYRCWQPGMSCGTPCGTSGLLANEPSWPTINGDPSSLTDNTAQWMELLVYLNQQIGTADSAKKITGYGQYYVLENRFVYFDNNNVIQPINAGAPQNILEVKLQSVGTSSVGTDCPGEQILTTLFTAY